MKKNNKILLINHKAKDPIRTPKVTIPLENNLKQNYLDNFKSVVKSLNKAMLKMKK